MCIRDSHEHDHATAHAHTHSEGDDLNLKSAYVHVLTDAATSILAIAALAGGAFFGWQWLDPAMGIVGAILISVWAVRLMGDSARVLLDCEMDHPVVAEVREAIEQHPTWATNTRIADLHVWRVGKSRFAVIVGLVTHDAELNPAGVRAVLAQHEELVHVSVEINYCPCDADSA